MAIKDKGCYPLNLPELPEIPCLEIQEPITPVTVQVDPPPPPFLPPPCSELPPLIDPPDFDLDCNVVEGGCPVTITLYFKAETAETLNCLPEDDDKQIDPSRTTIVPASFTYTPGEEGEVSVTVTLYAKDGTILERRTRVVHYGGAISDTGRDEADVIAKCLPPVDITYTCPDAVCPGAEITFEAVSEFECETLAISPPTYIIEKPGVAYNVPVLVARTINGIRVPDTAQVVQVICGTPEMFDITYDCPDTVCPGATVTFKFADDAQCSGIVLDPAEYSIDVPGQARQVLVSVSRETAAGLIPIQTIPVTVVCGNLEDFDVQAVCPDEVCPGAVVNFELIGSGDCEAVIEPATYTINNPGLVEVVPVSVKRPTGEFIRTVPVTVACTGNDIAVEADIPEDACAGAVVTFSIPAACPNVSIEPTEYVIEKTGLSVPVPVYVYADINGVRTLLKTEIVHVFSGELAPDHRSLIDGLITFDWECGDICGETVNIVISVSDPGQLCYRYIIKVNGEQLEYGVPKQLSLVKQTATQVLFDVVVTDAEDKYVDNFTLIRYAFCEVPANRESGEPYIVVNCNETQSECGLTTNVDLTVNFTTGECADTEYAVLPKEVLNTIVGAGEITSVKIFKSSLDAAYQTYLTSNGSNALPYQEYIDSLAAADLPEPYKIETVNAFCAGTPEIPDVFSFFECGEQGENQYYYTWDWIPPLVGYFHNNIVSKKIAFLDGACGCYLLVTNLGQVLRYGETYEALSRFYLFAKERAGYSAITAAFNAGQLSESGLIALADRKKDFIVDDVLPVSCGVPVISNPPEIDYTINPDAQTVTFYVIQDAASQKPILNTEYDIIAVDGNVVIPGPSATVPLIENPTKPYIVTVKQKQKALAPPNVPPPQPGTEKTVNTHKIPVTVGGYSTGDGGGGTPQPTIDTAKVVEPIRCPIDRKAVPNPFATAQDGKPFSGDWHPFIPKDLDSIEWHSTITSENSATLDTALCFGTIEVPGKTYTPTKATYFGGEEYDDNGTTKKRTRGELKKDDNGNQLYLLAREPLTITGDIVRRQGGDCSYPFRFRYGNSDTAGTDNSFFPFLLNGVPSRYCTNGDIAEWATTTDENLAQKNYDPAICYELDWSETLVEGESVQYQKKTASFTIPKLDQYGVVVKDANNAVEYETVDFDYYEVKPPKTYSTQLFGSGAVMLDSCQITRQQPYPSDTPNSDDTYLLTNVTDLSTELNERCERVFLKLQSNHARAELVNAVGICNNCSQPRLRGVFYKTDSKGRKYACACEVDYLPFGYAVETAKITCYYHTNEDDCNPLWMRPHYTIGRESQWHLRLLPSACAVACTNLTPTQGTTPPPEV